MALENDAIIAIAPHRVKFFGTTGQMLLPSIATIAAHLNAIPLGQILTTHELRQQLAEQFAVEAVCPETIKKALRALAHDPANTAPYWRIVNANRELMSYFPDGVLGHALHLEAEGVRLDKTGKKPKVILQKTPL